MLKLIRQELSAAKRYMSKWACIETLLNEKTMTWIKIISYEQATGALRKLYDRLKGADNKIDNIMLAHSLRPNSMNGHMALYKNVLHHSGNKIEKWILEMIGVHTSMQNECSYCVEHHFIGMENLLSNDDRASKIRESLKSGQWKESFDAKIKAALMYAEKLTDNPSNINESDIMALRDSGWDDGEILEINQVVAYFNYANRTVLGLSITTEGDKLGLSPGDSSDENNWQHQ